MFSSRKDAIKTKIKNIVLVGLCKGEVMVARNVPDFKVQGPALLPKLAQNNSHSE